MPKKKSKNAKKASKEEKEARKEAKQDSNKVHKQMGNMVGELSHQMLTSESQRLIAKLAPGCSLPPAEAHAVVTKVALLAGTDVDMNDADPYGDGDQSPVSVGGEESADIMSRFREMAGPSHGGEFDKAEPARQVIRELWSAGGDLESYLKFGGFSSFATSCCLGDSKAVKRAIKGTVEGDERVHLLERRESGMRFTPLLLCIAISKVRGYVCQITGAREADMDHLGVVKILLLHGARPDCKELAGKTAVHYGAGSRATADSLKMTDYSFHAAKSAAYFGKRVTLRNLKAEQFNGLPGVLGGFDADTGRRQVTLDNQKQLYILPQNIFSVREDKEVEDKEVEDKEVCIYDPSKNLLNECDRVGTISFHEVFLSPMGRVDVAEFLIERNVSVDITPPCGNSLRKLVYRPTPFGASTMHDLIRKHIVKIEKVEDGRCWGCGETGENFSYCTQCKKAPYCSRSCQKQHWRIHKADCQDPDENYSIQLSRPPAEAQFQINGEYKRPNGVDVDELFWVKVQCDLLNKGPHMVYDKSRSCKFFIMHGASGHLELFNRMKGAKAFSGTKLYFKAAFDGSGNFRVYPNISSTTKKW
eukprot:CAMPEP_0172302324 /NCGR_PEP_ID=MMETSP1058-20130122/4040_1 /TAXON_ID=83371 /ORGANISM="Detonula confervacea, Strain CCMP 353" /LENGTH=587 /DNA_ID=CAMNT_0013012749 /DNA_START=116 /DNA_END=1879 /DNA_ORIENTATION=-